MWVPPFFDCGECGSQIGRWPMTNLLGQEILDWRHRDIPPGTTPHRAVLGTPVPIKAVLGVIAPTRDDDGDDEGIAPDPVPPPEVPARPALAADLPPAAVTIDKLAQEHGWTVEAWFMRGTRIDGRGRPGRVGSTVVLRMWRDGHRLIAVWESAPGDKWIFDTGYSLMHHSAMVGSAELKRLIKFPRLVCEDCGKPPARHTLTPGGLVCFSEHP